jgi:tRNA(Ile)-lysidine synthase
MLHQSTKSLLEKGKNLLAFSAGGDSTALFFLLLQNNISFDIAIVDYAIRKQSKEEVAYAQALAQKHQLLCHVHEAEPITHNFEANARSIRYNFFEKLIETYQYDNLLTAHHLGDRLEWMLMQLCKGAGCVELSGMQFIQKRENYTLIRPLLAEDKEVLLHFLDKYNIHYFEDATNEDERYTRNAFRHQFAQPLLKKYKKGIAKSFEYIDQDKALLITPIKINKIKDFAYIEGNYSPRSIVYAIDNYFKSLGHIITAQERQMLLSLKHNCIIGRKYSITKHPKGFLFIAPYIKNTQTMPKTFKEEMRKLRIDPKLRTYLFLEKSLVLFLSRLLA